MNKKEKIEQIRKKLETKRIIDKFTKGPRCGKEDWKYYGGMVVGGFAPSGETPNAHQVPVSRVCQVCGCKTGEMGNKVSKEKDYALDKWCK